MQYKKQNACTLSYDDNPNSEDIEQLTKGLADYAKKEKGVSPIKPFAFWIKNHEAIFRADAMGLSIMAVFTLINFGLLNHYVIRDMELNSFKLVKS